MKPVRIYTKTHCPYSVRAREILASKGVDYEEIDIAKHPEKTREMHKASGGHTVPQIFIGGELIGGCEELAKLEGSGELEGLLDDGAAASP